ncbi:MAG: hemerythrin domain-containing protein [Legionella sp.]|nr:hemerythrin domain-containing protein [Legionella sp.]
MDLYQYLKMDHQFVSKLFKQFEKSELLDRKKQIITMLCNELLAHAESEQMTFYRVLEQDPLTKPLAIHGKREHQDIEDHIRYILNAKSFGVSWQSRVKKLQDVVSHHVKEEEGAIFRKAKKVLSEKDAAVIKEKMHYLKENLLRKLQKKLYFH